MSSLDSFLEDFPIYESYIDGKMTRRIKAKEYLVLLHTEVYKPSCVYSWKMYLIILLINILGLNVYIENLMSWIHSLNLRRDRITYWVNILGTSIERK